MTAIRSFGISCLLLASSAFTINSASAQDPLLARIQTSVGDIVIELDEQRAPGTVKNFQQYADSGFYDGTIFHRVIEGFMIQGGGFSQNYMRKQTRRPITNEAVNGLSNLKYSIAMARTSSPHSATSQFFINGADNTNLDHTGRDSRGWGYAVFGRVVEGHDVVDQISEVATGAAGPFRSDVPRDQVIILTVDIQKPQIEADVQASGAGAGSDDETSIKQPAGVTAKPSTTQTQQRLQKQRAKLI